MVSLEARRAIQFIPLIYGIVGLSTLMWPASRYRYQWMLLHRHLRRLLWSDYLLAPCQVIWRGHRFPDHYSLVRFFAVSWKLW